MKSTIFLAIAPIFFALLSLLLQLPVYENLGKLYIEIAVIWLILFKIIRLDLGGRNLLTVAPCLTFIVYTTGSFVVSNYDWGFSTFLISIKYWVLLLVLCISRKEIIDGQKFSEIVSFFIKAFFIVYTLELSLGIERPTLFFENNFEMVLLLFGYLYSRKFGPGVNIDDLLILFLVLFSGSRSILLGYIIIIMYKLTLQTWAIRLIGFALVLITVSSYIVAFNHRILTLSDPQGVDRFIFSLLAYREMISSSWETWLVGKGPFEPVNTEICDRLEYYRRFFLDDKLCHSSIFHAQILRALRDYGLIGLVSSFFLCWIYLKRISISGMHLAVGFALVLVSSASISGLGNSFLMYIALLAPFKDRNVRLERR
jgi:hypothetical protein